MPNSIFTEALDIIAGLIAGQCTAESGRYRVVWIKDHFEIHKINNPFKDSYLIIILQARDINEGLTKDQWNIIERRLKVLIETGVIK